MTNPYVATAASPVTHCTEYALKTYFGYKSTLRGVLKSSYTDANWINLLKAEVDASRPIVYAGSGTGGGHAFVCDGYDNNNKFHFNWGWSGYYDGYFAINALNPDGQGTGGGTGAYNTNQHAVIGIVPASGGGGPTPTTNDLRLYSSLTMSATNIWFGDNFSVTASIGNYSTNAFSGQLGAAVFDYKGDFVDFLQTGSVNISGSSFNTYTFNKTGSILLVPGTYYVAIFYKTGTQDWTIVGDGSYTNLKQFKIVYSANIETHSNFTITTNGGKLIQGKSATVNVNVKNTGTTTFYGKFCVSLSKLDGTWAQDIQILSENNGLMPNYFYTGGNNFTGTITVPPGTYLMQTAYQRSGDPQWYYAGSTNYQNPVYVIVEAAPIQQDAYEPNNTQAQAYNLPVSFSGNNASVKTTGSNLHNTTDIDYYKIVLPTGYKYTVKPRLHDKYDSGNGLTYTVDALFAYSTNGTTYSDAYDDVMPGNITLNSGGTVYFVVAPYFAGNIGTYLLDIQITRTATSDIDDVELNNQISIYPNPAKDILTVESGELKIDKIEIFDLTGKTLLTTHYSLLTTNSIDVSNLSNGIYLLQIYSDMGVLNKKIIIKK